MVALLVAGGKADATVEIAGTATACVAEVGALTGATGAVAGTGSGAGLDEGLRIARGTGFNTGGGGTGRGGTVGNTSASSACDTGCGDHGVRGIGREAISRMNRFSAIASAIAMLRMACRVQSDEG